MPLPTFPRTTGTALTVAMLVASNILMTFAWYGQLHPRVKGFVGHLPMIAVIALSWGIAFFEYCILVPANRIGSDAGLTLPQLKIIQEVITVCVFLAFLVFVMGEKFRWDYLWALLCMVGAVYFVNRSRL